MLYTRARYERGPIIESTVESTSVQARLLNRDEFFETEKSYNFPTF